jgi:Pyridoxamine 5'-phosphate oxidase
MATWQEVTTAAPELAEAVRARFDAHRHKVLATLRKDGSPRISGVEATFKDGELWLGMMHESRKALDLLRDPRLALHSATTEPADDPRSQPADEPIDVKIAGRAVEVTDPAALEQFSAGAPAGPFHLFRIDLTEVVLIRIGDPADHLVIESWHEGVGLRAVKRT